MRCCAPSVAAHEVPHYRGPAAPRLVLRQGRPRRRSGGRQPELLFASAADLHVRGFVAGAAGGPAGRHPDVPEGVPKLKATRPVPPSSSSSSSSSPSSNVEDEDEDEDGQKAPS